MGSAILRIILPVGRPRIPGTDDQEEENNVDNAHALTFGIYRCPDSIVIG